MSTTGNIESHVKVCPDRIFSCKIKDCKFEGIKDEFHKHILSEESHFNQILNEFDKNNQDVKKNIMGLLQTKVNSMGKTARRGTSGKFYCGEKSDVTCSGCDGRCGPSNGCQCTHCMKLDMEFYNLPIGFTLNHDGNFCRFIEGGFYCGIRVSSSSYCAPDNAICAGCSRISNLTPLINFMKALIESKK